MTRRVYLSATLVATLVALAGCSESEQERAERLERAPGEACNAIYESEVHLNEGPRGDTGGYFETKDDLDAARDIAEDELDGATEPNAVVIRRYLEHSRTNSDAIGQTGDIGATSPGGHRLLVSAAQACTSLGFPELQNYLYEETGDEDYAP